MKRLGFFTLCFAVLFSLPAAADDGALYRELLDQKSHAVVNVKIVLKLNINFNGNTQEQEQNIEVQGVVVDPSGIVMVSLQAIDPEVEERQGLSIKFTPMDMEVKFNDEDDLYEAIVGVKDDNLNLAYLIIKDLKDMDLTLLTSDFAKASIHADVKVGEELFGVSRYGEGFDYAPYFGLTRVVGKVELPRPCFSLSSGFRRLGHPMFNKEGKFAGVVSNQKGSEGAETGPGGSGNSGSFLIPAATFKANMPMVIEKCKEALKKDKEKGDEDEDEELDEEEDD